MAETEAGARMFVEAMLGRKAALRAKVMVGFRDDGSTGVFVSGNMNDLPETAKPVMAAISSVVAGSLR